MPEIKDNPKIIDDFSGGILKDVSMFKMPEEVVPHAINFVFDEEIGSAKLRKGTAMVGSQIINDKAVLGLTNLRRRGDTKHVLLATLSDGTNNDIYNVVTGAKITGWTDDTKDIKTRFCQFLDSVVRVNGTDSAESYNGTTVITTGGVFDLANMPKGDFVLNYKDRVHVLTDAGLLYSSSIPRFFLDYDAQSSNFTEDDTLTGGTSGATGIIRNDTDAGAAGTLELTGVSGTFQDNETITDPSGGSADVKGAGTFKINWLNGSISTAIDPDNGDKGKATGLGKIGGLMLIFFERAMYSWNSVSTEADELVGIGCSSSESIAVDKNSGLLFFANKDGAFITRGGYPQKISRFVQPYFDNMASSNYQHIAGGCDGQHYFCSLGDVTIDKKTVENVVVRYTIQSQEWAVLSYPTQPRVFSSYISGTDVKLVYGDDDGNVIEIDSSDENDNYAAVTDVPINYELDMNDIWQPLLGIKKSIQNKIVVLSEDSSGAKFLFRVDSIDEENWKPVGEIKKNIHIFKQFNIKKFHYLRFRIQGRSTCGRLLIRGIEIPSILLHGY